MSERSAMPYLIDTLYFAALFIGPAVPLIACLFIPAKPDQDGDRRRR